jgi:hypothetical protein
LGVGSRNDPVPQGRLILSIDLVHGEEFLKFVRKGNAFVVLMLGLDAVRSRLAGKLRSRTRHILLAMRNVLHQGNFREPTSRSPTLRVGRPYSSREYQAEKAVNARGP